MEDGLQKAVTEAYVLDALNFTEAEGTIIDEMKVYITGDFNVSTISKATYKEVFFSDNPRDDRWYKVKIQFITIDEKSGKEKLTASTFLVQSNTFQNAVKSIEEVMNTGMQDWKIAAVSETSIVDVFEHDGTKHVNKPQEDERAEYEDALRHELDADQAE